MTTEAPRPAALGFTAHTGWAVAVAVSGPLTSPKLIHRGKIDLRPGKESVQVFHVAAEMAPTDAKRHVERCSKAAADTARKELTSLIKSLAHEVSPVAVGVVVGNAARPTSLDAVLRSHLLIHSAEGDLFRRAIVEAGAALELTSLAMPSRDLALAASRVLKVSQDGIPQWLGEFGRTVGRPWGRDEKDAFLVACLALANHRRVATAS